ncbi:hypothetical protein D3C73_467010 [compost metagenome]
MNSKKSLFLWGGVIFTTTISLLLWRSIILAKDNFSCEGSIYLTQGNKKISAILHFTFNNGIGKYTNNGEVTLNGKAVNRVNKQLYFHYWREGDNIIITSDNPNISPAYDSQLSTLIPDFFVYQGRSIIMQMQRQNASSYLVTQNNMPFLYCTITERHFLPW